MPRAHRDAAAPGGDGEDAAAPYYYARWFVCTTRDARTKRSRAPRIIGLTISTDPGIAL
jgi:hypothetical protein